MGGIKGALGRRRRKKDRWPALNKQGEEAAILPASPVTEMTRGTSAVPAGSSGAATAGFFWGVLHAASASAETLFLVSAAVAGESADQEFEERVRGEYVDSGLKALPDAVEAERLRNAAAAVVDDHPVHADGASPATSTSGGAQGESTSGGASPAGSPSAVDTLPFVAAVLQAKGGTPDVAVVAALAAASARGFLTGEDRALARRAVRLAAGDDSSDELEDKEATLLAHYAVLPAVAAAEAEYRSADDGAAAALARSPSPANFTPDGVQGESTFGGSPSVPAMVQFVAGVLQTGEASSGAAFAAVAVADAAVAASSASANADETEEFLEKDKTAIINEVVERLTRLLRLQSMSGVTADRVAGRDITKSKLTSVSLNDDVIRANFEAVFAEWRSSLSADEKESLFQEVKKRFGVVSSVPTVHPRVPAVSVIASNGAPAPKKSLVPPAYSEAGQPKPYRHKCLWNVADFFQCKLGDLFEFLLGCVEVFESRKATTPDDMKKIIEDALSANTPQEKRHKAIICERLYQEWLAYMDGGCSITECKRRIEECEKSAKAAVVVDKKTEGVELLFMVKENKVEDFWIDFCNLYGDIRRFAIQGDVTTADLESIKNRNIQLLKDQLDSLKRVKKLITQDSHFGGTVFLRWCDRDTATTCRLEKLGVSIELFSPVSVPETKKEESSIDIKAMSPESSATFVAVAQKKTQDIDPDKPVDSPEKFCEAVQKALISYRNRFDKKEGDWFGPITWQSSGSKELAQTLGDILNDTKKEDPARMVTILDMNFLKAGTSLKKALAHNLVGYSFDSAGHLYRDYKLWPSDTKQSSVTRKP